MIVSKKGHSRLTEKINESWGFTHLWGFVELTLKIVWFLYSKLMNYI